MLTEAVALETAYDAKEGLAEDIVKFALAHTAEALSEHKRVLGLAEVALAETYGEPCTPHLRRVVNSAMAAIAELKTNEKPKYEAGA